MSNWWELTGDFPSYRRATDGILKDYGYMYLLRYLQERSPARILEFGHGFNATLFEALAQRDDMEIWGVDDYQGLGYFPDREAWEQRYREELVERYPRARFVRGLMGLHGSARPHLPENYFDLVCSVSVLEEIRISEVIDVLTHCRALLKDGGSLINSHDVQLPHWQRAAQFIDAHRQAGFDPGIDPQRQQEIAQGRSFDSSEIVIQNPARVMLNKKTYRGEHEPYGGHVSTIVAQVTKDADMAARRSPTTSFRARTLRALRDGQRRFPKLFRALRRVRNLGLGRTR
ncbi:MAG: class I SAM-dependent methyltransferase [Acidobacteriota bacterium]